MFVCLGEDTNSEDLCDVLCCNAVGKYGVAGVLCCNAVGKYGVTGEL